MIGQAEWFERRKYTGWGLSPKNWKGWVYIIVIIIPLVVFQALPLWTTKTRILVTGAWALFLFVDVIDMMIHIKKDEREKMHEALAERNATWSIVVILSIGLAYQVIRSALYQKILVDWWIVAAILIGTLVKSISNYRLEKKN